MKLSIDFANQALQVVLGFFSKPPAQAAAFVKSVHTKCFWMRPERFQKVCEVVSGELPENGRLPQYGKFIAVYNNLADQLNWRAHDRASHVDCKVCNEEGWVKVRLYNPKWGITDNFLKPCPECKRSHPSGNLPLPAGWVETEEPLTWPTVTTPTEKTVRYLASLYEGFDDTMVPELAMKQFDDKRRTMQLKIRPLKKDVFSEILHAAVTRRPEAPSEGPAAGSPPAVPSPEPGEDREEEGELPPF